MFKRISIEQCQKIQNLVRVVGENGFEDEENIDFLIVQATPILYGENFKPDLSTNKKKINFKTKVMADIDETLKKYRRYKERKQNNDRIYVSFNGKTYISNYINVKTYFYINNRISEINRDELREKFWNSLGEEVLLMLFSNILLAEDFEEIKVEDPIYYEIIIDDVISLILKELKEISGIKRVKKPYEEPEKKKLIELKETEEESLYSLFLENYHIMPEDLNKNRAYDILKTLSTISNRAVVSDMEKVINDIKDPLMRDTVLVEIEESLK